jgi:hypothetical protein
MFAHTHFLYVKHIAPVEDLEHYCALSTENHDFFLSDLMSETHIGRHPIALVYHRGLDLLPNIAFDIVALDSVYNAFLVNSSSEGKHVVVLEGTERNTSSWNAHFCEDLPFVLLTVILLTVAENLVVNKGTNYIEEALDGTDRVISVRIVHTSYLKKSPEELVVAVATLKIHIHGLEVSTCQINSTSLNRNRARVKGNFVLHGNRSALELTCFNLIDLGAALVPLEGVESLNPGCTKTVFSIKVYSQVRFNQVVEFLYYFIRIFIQKSLKLRNTLIIIKVLFVLSI